MRNNFFKFFSLLSIAAGFFAAVWVYASFGATAMVTGAEFSTGVLDLGATSTIDFAPELSSGGDEATRTVDLANTGTLDLKYAVSVQLPANNVFCQSLTIKDDVGGDFVPLAGYTSPAAILAAGQSDTLTLTVKSLLAGKLPAGNVCDFHLVFDAWQADFEDAALGFTAQRVIPSTVMTPADSPTVTVEYPNGGEQWYIMPDECLDYAWCRTWCRANGMTNKCEYEIRWNAKSGDVGPNSALVVDIWYSTDSGDAWIQQVANHIPNTGKFNWKIPVDSRLVSDTARIKVAAYDKQNELVWSLDESDADFCPPVLTIEDLVNRVFSEGSNEGSAGNLIADDDGLKLANETPGEEVGVIAAGKDEILGDPAVAIDDQPEADSGVKIEIGEAGDGTTPVPVNILEIEEEDVVGETILDSKPIGDNNVIASGDGGVGADSVVAADIAE